MRLGVSSYSYQQLIRRGDIKQIDVIELASNMGFDVLEFINFTLQDGETEEDFAQLAKARSEELQLPIESYTIGGDFINGCDGDLELEIQRLKKQVDIAHLLGVKSMRHDATSGFPKGHHKQSFDEALPRLIKGYRVITEYASTYGIKTMVENHGFFCQDSERVERLVSGVSHNNFGVLIDIGNFLCVDEDPCKAIGRLMPYAFHIHAKDFHFKSGMEPDPGEGWFMTRGGNYLRGAIIGHGNVPILQCLRILKRADYEGTLSIEFEGMEDPMKAIPMGFKNLKHYLDNI